MKLSNIIIFTFLVFITSNVLASKEKVAKGSDAKENDYYANYYDQEGALLFKIRGFYASTKATTKGLPSPTNLGASEPGRIAQNGYGFDTAMTIFVSDNIAGEISLGLGYYKTKTSTLAIAKDAYGTSKGAAVTKKNEIIMIPVTMALQYHVAPFGAIRPYVGGGINGTYLYTRSKAIKVSPAYGPVLQIGVDFIAKDDTLFTLDVKQYFFKSRMEFKQKFLGTAKNVSSKVTWNPLVISAGFGFKF